MKATPGCGPPTSAASYDLPTGRRLPPLDKPRVRDEWGYLIGQAIGSLRIR
jgi:hypothetical protein